MVNRHDEVQHLMRQVGVGRLSRRDFMRRGLALGFSASAVAAFLAACGTAATAPTATTAPTTAPTVAPTRAATTAAAPTTAAAAPTTAAAPTAAAPTTAAAPAAAGAPATSAGGGAVAAPIPATQTRTGVTDTEVVIGSWGPQDGPAGAYGVIDRTIAGYFGRVNEAGGVNGRRIRFIYENDSYQPQRTVAAVRKLVEEDKVFALVGGLGTPNNVAVEKYLTDNFIPHIAPATGSSLLSIPLKRNIFAVQLNYIVEATLMTRYALDTAGSKKFAVFYQNDAFGKEGLDSIQAELQKRGQPAATAVSYETTDTNFSAQALRLQSSGADTVIIWAVPRPGGSIIQEITKIGFKPKLFSSAVINDPSIFQLAGPGIEGMITTAYYPDFKDTSDPKIVEFRNFMTRYLPNEQIGSFASTGYMYGQIMTELLTRAGKDLTREGFVRSTESLQDYTGSLLPSLSFSPTDHQGAKACYFQQAKGQEFVKISDYIKL